MSLLRRPRKQNRSGKRHFFGVCMLILAVAVVQQFSRARPFAPVAPQVSGPRLQAVTLIFGSRDPGPEDWSGSAQLSNGTIEKIAGYHFTEESKILNANAWSCASHPWPAISFDLAAEDKATPYPTRVQPIGVTIHFRAPAEAVLTVTVPRGSFSFRPAEINEPAGIFPLGNRVEVHRTPVVEQLTDEQYEDDYPSLASDGDVLWTAWQGYQNDTDGVFLRRYKNGTWGERLTVSEKPGDFFMTGVAASRGQVMVVWSENQSNNWRLNARRYDGSRFSATETVTPSGGNSLFHRVVAGAQGAFHVAYQSWRSGRSDIYVRTHSGGIWGAEVNLGDPNRSSRANDWNPAIVIDREGSVWVAWDSYADGSYNIFLRPIRDGKPGELMQVTQSRRYHANPSLAVDALNRVWIAWDEGPENWGKDYGFLVAKGSPLYESRTVKVAVWSGGRWLTTLQQPGALAPQSSYYHMQRYFHTPRLVADSAGRVWLFLRPLSAANWRKSIAMHGGKWEVFATYYSEDRWSDLFLIPDSVGRNGGAVEVAADSQQNVYVAMVSDHRPWGGANTGRPPRNNDVMFTALKGQGAVPVELAPLTPEAPTKLPSEPKEAEQIAALRRHVIQVGGKTYRIYRGDLHRHTEISSDGPSDGTLWDAYRYAMDAAGLDFLAVTDHQSGGQRYTWWRIDKSADMFHVPNFFTAIYGTERSLPYPNGHRNLFFTKRGVEILPSSPDERTGKQNSGSVVYPFLRSHGGLASSHTSNTNMGTDWRDNDQDLEPLVEIYQGIRTSAEHEGAPLAMSRERPELWAGGYRPEGFVWNAWAKGLKLGVQASSDHNSTHRSYACLIAEGFSREALFDAMRKRHSYAATANILLDYRMEADGQTYIQGDILRSRSLPTLRVRVIGSTILKRIHVIRDNTYIYSVTPQAETEDFLYKEIKLSPGEHYYYVRVEQEDGNLAWSSPIWLTYVERAAAGG